jgi:hypothetical protein
VKKREAKKLKEDNLLSEDYEELLNKEIEKWVNQHKCVQDQEAQLK